MGHRPGAAAAGGSGDASVPARALAQGGDVDQLYRDALQALADIQVRGRDSALQLPAYDREVLVREMALMPEWFCARHLQLELTRGAG